MSGNYATRTSPIYHKARVLLFTILVLCIVVSPRASAMAARRSTSSHAAFVHGAISRAVSAPAVLSWDTSTASLPQPLSRPAAAVGHDGKIYVFGGTANGTEVDTTYVYDPLRNSWTQGAPMPTAREGAQAVTLPDGRIAVLGGGMLCGTILCDHGIVLRTVDVYDPVSNAWTALPSMLTPRYRLGAVVVGGQIYAIGGSDGSTVVASVEAFDFNTNQWTSAPSLPHPLQAAAVVAAANGDIEVAGGADDFSNLGTLFIYNGSSWRSGAAMPETTADMGGTLGPDGEVYVIGGFDGTWVTTVQVYDPATDSWSYGTALPAPTCCAGIVTANGEIFAFGGADGPPMAQVAIGSFGSPLPNTATPTTPTNTPPATPSSTPSSPTNTATPLATSAPTNTATPLMSTSTATPQLATGTSTPIVTLTQTASPASTATAPPGSGTLIASYGGTPPSNWIGGVSQRYTLAVTNMGTATWNASGTNAVRLGIHFKSGTATGAGWATDQRFALPRDVGPGSAVTIPVTVTAPLTAGTYTVQAQMVKERVAWFRQVQDSTAHVSTLVATYRSHPPAVWTHGSSQAYSVVVTNMGTLTWNAGGTNPVRLAIHFSIGGAITADTGWVTDQRFRLPSDVPPGGSVTIPVIVTAPSQAGSYVLQAQMVKENIAWFQQAQRTPITVT